MSTLTINKQNALKAYNETGKEGKALLENLFGKEVVPGNIKDRVSCFEHICREAGENIKDYEITAGMSDREIGIRASKRVMLIYEVCNEGWYPDFSNSDQPKYYPYWEFKPGSGFSYYYYANAGTSSAVGARLCTYSAEMAKWIAENFKDDFQFFLIKN